MYLDEDTPLLKALLLRGGHLVFDDNQDVMLKAEYILILGGGSITVSRGESVEHHSPYDPSLKLRVVVTF